MDDDKNTPIEGEIIMPEQTHSKTLENRTVEDVMEDSFLRYSMSVIIDRSLDKINKICYNGNYRRSCVLF